MTEPFEAEYQRLRQAGKIGWGGDAGDSRLAGWQALLQRFEPELGVGRAGLRVLELGCGNGVVSAELAARGCTVSGIDISPTAIDWARSGFAAAGLAGQFFVGDVCDMPQFEAGSFDLVIDGNCLHCIIGDRRASLFSEVHRVLTEGGRFFVSSMCAPPRSAEALAMYDGDRQCLMREGQPWRCLAEAASINEECRGHGFDLLAADKKENPWWDHLSAVFERRAG